MVGWPSGVKLIPEFTEFGRKPTNAGPKPQVFRAKGQDLTPGAETEGYFFTVSPTMARGLRTTLGHPGNGEEERDEVRGARGD